MKFTRFFSLLLMVLLLSFCLGCEKIDLSGGASKPSSSETPQSGDPNTLIVKTTVAGIETFRPQGGASPKTDKILSHIEQVEKETGVTVSVEIVSQDSLSTAFLRACRAGTKYADVIQTKASFLCQYYEEGYFLPLSEAGVSPSATGNLKAPDGTSYALRADGWNNPLPTLSYLMYYNQKLLADNGEETPLERYEAGLWNWQSFEEICQTLCQGSEEVYAIAAPTKEEPALLWATLHAAGAVYFDKNSLCIMDSQQAQNGFAALKKLLNSGVTYHLASNIYETSDATALLAFSNRRTAFLVDNSALLFQSGEGSLSANLEEDLRIIEFPTMEENLPGSSFTQDDVFCGITSLANKDLCKKLLPRIFSAPEGSDPNAEFAADHFYHEKDAELYADLLSSADTDTSLFMGDKRALVEEYFLQVANGASAKEYLSNLQTIFNSQKKG